MDKVRRQILHDALTSNEWKHSPRKYSNVYACGENLVAARDDGSVNIYTGWGAIAGLITFGANIPDLVVSITALALQSEAHEPF